MFNTIDQGVQSFKEEMKNYLIKCKKDWCKIDQGWKEGEEQKLNGMAIALGLSREEVRIIRSSLEKDI
jgi:hypothetical protein